MYVLVLPALRCMRQQILRIERPIGMGHQVNRGVVIARYVASISALVRLEIRQDPA